MIGTTIGMPFVMMVELELTEATAPDKVQVARVVLPIGGALEYTDQEGNLMATIKVTSIFRGKSESSSSSEQSSSDGERLPTTPEVSSPEATDVN